MQPTTLRRILKAYGITSYQLLRVQKGYRNYSYVIQTGDKICNLILFKHEPKIITTITRANAVSEYAARQGMPTRQLADPRILQASHGNVKRYLALYTYLPGQTIAWEAYTMRSLKALGQSHAQLHQVIQSYNGPLPAIEQQCHTLQLQMQRYFTNYDVEQAMESKLRLRVQTFDFNRLFSMLQKQPRQALHMDFVRGNILYTGDRISGIIDFEKVATGNPAFDIARTLAFLLIDCKYKTPAEVWRYYIQSGYCKHGRGTITVTPQQLRQLMLFYLLHDFYKFLRHNPYEFLKQNEHYQRTAAQLHAAGLIVKL